MKNLVIVFVIFTFSTKVIGQCDSSLIGNWKIISVKSPDGFFNLRTDSVVLTTVIAGEDSVSDKQFVVDMHKMMFGSLEFNFTSGTQFGMRFMGELVENNRYCFDRKKGIITVISKNSLGEDKTDEWPAKINDNLLVIFMKLGGDGGDKEKKFELTLQMNT